MFRAARFVRRLGGLVCASIAAGAVLGSGAPVAIAAGPVTCRTYSGIPVALAPGEAASYSVVGELCATPSELSNGETVELLIHGATYNHTYWDFGTIDGVRYSYARDVAAAGFPTFAIDEIGAGQSSHPPSTDVSLQSAAYVAHEIVQDLLGGSIAATRFGKVIEVGHSFGSFTTWEEAGTYHDVAAAIITGAVHALTAAALNDGPSDLYPAIDDPQFAGTDLDSGYLTTAPGTREPLFYNSADADPNVIARDEATKDAVSATEFGDGIPEVNSTISQEINVPVLVMVGSNDFLFCGVDGNGTTFDCSSGQAIANQESPWYSAAAQLRACTIPTSGHDINLARNHDVEEADSIAWTYEYVGQRGVPPIPSRALPSNCSGR